MPEQNRTDSFTFSFNFWRLLLHVAIICVGLLLGLLSWYISKPQTTRFYETNVEQRQKIKVTPCIEIILDKESAVSVTESQPVRIELFKGSAHFDTSGECANELEIKVGKAFIRNAGARFRISMHIDGSSNNIAIDEGQIEIFVKFAVYLVNAGEQANFNGFDVYEHKLISETDISPWYVD